MSISTHTFTSQNSRYQSLKTGDITAALVYGTSKGAVNAFTKSLARQLAGYGIRVNAVAPHAIDTDMSAEWSAEKRAEVMRSISLGRFGTVPDVAEAACFLVSDASAFITGVTHGRERWFSHGLTRLLSQDCRDCSVMTTRIASTLGVRTKTGLQSRGGLNAIYAYGNLYL